MTRITAICRERKVPLIEDAAQAFGGTWRGRQAGTFGDAGIYSFGMYKNVNSFFGGMLVTPRADLNEWVRAEMGRLPYQSMPLLLRKVASAAMTDIVTFPMVFRNFTFRLFRYAFLNDVNAINERLKIDVNPEIKRQMPAEYLARMTPLQARLILSQLDRVENDMSRRIRAARRWHAALQGLPEIILPPLRDDGSHIYWYFPLQYAERHKLVAYAMERGCDITESYHRNCAALPCFAQYARDCPRAEAVASSLIYLPVYPRYTDAEIDRTAAVIRSFFGK
jgi:dTDP-4-amino-4,6-dideoxygalactose transaminase